MARIAPLRHDSRFRPDGSISIELVATICFIVIFALATLETGVGLGADADALPALDEGYFGADAEGFAYNFYLVFSMFLFSHGYSV